MHPEDILFYYRSMDDDSGVVMKRSRIKPADTPLRRHEDRQLTLPFYNDPA
jgi:hypothetical protein